MSENMRTFLQRVTPLIAVQGFLLGLNIVTSIGDRNPFPWSFIPIMAMGIPEMIIASRIFLGGGQSHSNQIENREQRNADRQTARAERRGDVKTADWQTSQAVKIDPDLIDHIGQARAYQQEIDRIAKAASGKGIHGARMAELANQFAGWTKQVETMAERVTVLRRNPLVKQDLRAVPDAIKKLEAQLARETDARIRGQIERTLSARRSQLEALQKLENTTRHAETQLELTIASLGTIYSQTLAGQSTNQIADYSHLASEVDEQVRDLRDQLDALEEVRLGTAQGNLGD